MIYKRLWFSLMLQVILIIALALFVGWIYWESGHPYWVVIVLFVIAVLCYRLIKDLNVTNRMLSQFFVSIHDEDFVLNIPSKERGESFSELANRLEEVSRCIQDLRFSSKQKEIVGDTIIENALVGIILLAKDGLVKVINRKGRELLGVHHLVSVKALLKVDPAIVDLFEKLTSGENRILKTRIAGQEMHLAVNCTIIKLDKKELKLISFSDIKNEIDATELESWQKLINVLTHEIMNSVAPITSLTTTLVRSYESIDMKTGVSQMLLNKTQKGLRVIHEQSNGLMDFVESYRKLTGIPKPRIKPVSANSLLEHLKTLALLEEDASVCFDFILEGMDFQINVDENQIIQVLLNLLKNARQAIPDHGNVRCSFYSDVDGGAYITIEDDGEGIREEDMKSIFVPFFTTKEDGSGIGMSVSRQIMRLHKGQISVESLYGVGTKVKLVFPNGKLNINSK